MVSDRRLVRDHAALISLVTRSLDAIAIAGVALLAYILRFGEFSPLPKAYIALVAIGVLLSRGCNKFCVLSHDTDPRRGTWQDAPNRRLMMS